jgi:type IV conjugative transfer system protein TraE
MGVVNMDRFWKTWNGLNQANAMLTAAVALLAVVCLLLAIMLMTMERQVVYVPLGHPDELVISSDSTDQHYQESFAQMFAALLGNFTPEGLPNIRAIILPLVSPELSATLDRSLSLQVTELQEQRVSQRFVATTSQFEPATGKVFVTGIATTTGVTGAEQEEETTYEFIIRARNYRPQISHLQVYAGRPRTRQFLERDERRREAELERLRRNGQVETGEGQ